MSVKINEAASSNKEEIVRRTLIAGNWKMNGDSQFITELLEGINTQLDTSWQSEVLVCPPTVYLPLVIDITKENPISVGAQNLSSQDKGAFTGEVSGAMLKDIGCQYVLVGHSERRDLYKETSAVVAEKFNAALEKGLIPILCIGETLEQRENGTTMDVVTAQIDAVLSLGAEHLAKGVIAYEPVWAIGTGVTATPEQAQAVHADIRSHIAEQNAQIAQEMRILYGGSMNASNAEKLLAQADIDGGLIGGASLKANEFIAICKAAG